MLCACHPALRDSALTQDPLGLVELAEMDKQGSKLVFRIEGGRVVLAQRRDAALEIPARQRFGLRVPCRIVQHRGQEVDIAEGLPVVRAANPGIDAMATWKWGSARS